LNCMLARPNQRGTVKLRKNGLTRHLKTIRAPIPCLAWLLSALLIALAFAQEAVTISDEQIAKLAQTFGAVARERLTNWRGIMTNPKNRSLSERQKLDLVNDFMNQTRFISDREHWGKEDYWATPVEFLSTNGGDCEDFSIAKYFTLRALGVPDEKLQITYVKEIKVYNEAHMVLAYFATQDAEPLILDNINKTIQPASTRTDLVPVYSFNGSGLWLAKQQQGRGQSVGSSDRIGHWKDLQTRMKNAS
jgi:predicted transglutaminase-like cysteine proteinase